LLVTLRLCLRTTPTTAEGDKSSLVSRRPFRSRRTHPPLLCVSTNKPAHVEDNPMLKHGYEF
jgi:hypothetical protein